MHRRRDLTGWLLMAVLFIGAMALIFYILLMRAQSLARMEDGRNEPDPEPEARVEQLAERQMPLVMHAGPGNTDEVPHVLVFAASLA